MYENEIWVTGNRKGSLGVEANDIARPTYI